MKLIAVEGMELTISPKTVSATIGIATPPNTNIKAEGNGVYMDGTVISLTKLEQGIDGASFVFPGPVPLTFNSSATKVSDNSVEKTPVLLQGDSTNSVEVTLTDPTTTATVVVDVSVSITAAGQSTVFGS